MRNEKIAKIEKFQVAYDQAESDANAKFNHTFIVDHATVADKKDRPKRMIMVLVSFMGALMFSILIVLIQKRINEMKAIEK